jgi:hypothetical protein
MDLITSNPDVSTHNITVGGIHYELTLGGAGDSKTYKLTTNAGRLTVANWTGQWSPLAILLTVSDYTHTIPAEQSRLVRRALSQSIQDEVARHRNSCIEEALRMGYSFGSG